MCLDLRLFYFYYKNVQWKCYDAISDPRSLVETRKEMSMDRREKGVRQCSTLMYKEEPKNIQSMPPPPTTFKFIIENMKNWKTTLNLNHINGSLTQRPINIKSGIFQGDSLSPLLFSLALTPLSCLRNDNSYGYYRMANWITHSIVMILKRLSRMTTSSKTYPLLPKFSV